MNEARPRVFHTNRKKSSLPTELEYANDSDFPFECKKAEHRKRTVKETLGDRTLEVNEETFITRDFFSRFNNLLSFLNYFIWS